MRKFFYQLLWFVVPISLIFISGLFLPTTPRASTSLLLASVNKDSLLKNTPSPRLIFVGGSNLSFSLNSQTIKDSLHINPINTAIHASIGLKFMLDNTLQYIKAGDTVVLVPEYVHFYRDYNFGSEALLRIVYDVNTRKSRFLSLGQIINLIPYLPKYTLSKIEPTEYFHVKEDEIYGVNSFNQYGDAYKHWGKQRESFAADDKITDEYNPIVMQKIKEFQSEILKRKAVLFVSFPGYQDSSFLHSVPQIKKIENEYIKNKFKIIGTPERYMIPDSLMFNTSYHLQKAGADYRTALFIADFKKARMLYKNDQQ